MKFKLFFLASLLIYSCTNSDKEAISLLNFLPSDSRVIININNLNNISKETGKIGDFKKFMENNIQKEKDKEIYIKQTIDRREKEFIKECCKKVAHANQMSDELGLKKIFTTLSDNVNNF